MIINHSWLAKNNYRNYPFADSATPIQLNGLVDLRVSAPDVIADRLYIKQLVVGQAKAMLVLAADQYAGLDGTDEVARFEVLRPAVYRSYPINNTVTGVYGVAAFGEAATTIIGAVSQTFTPTTGAICPSLITSYLAAQTGGVGVESVGAALDRAEILGLGGLVVEVADVVYETGLEDETVPSLVIRLEDQTTTMTSMLTSCNTPVESGVFADVVTSVNGVRPDGDGVVNLEILPHYFPATESTAPENIVVTGGAAYDITMPRISLTQVSPNTLGIVDYDDYNQYCTARKAIRLINYRERRCASCVGTLGNQGGDIDGQGGAPVSFSGAYVTGNTLVIRWNVGAVGTLQPGNNSLSITIATEDGRPPVTVSGVTGTTGGGAMLGADQVPCSAAALGGVFGFQSGTSTYTLNRTLAAGEKFSLSGALDVVRSALAANLYAPSSPFSTCWLVARDPEYVEPSIDEVLPKS